MAKEYTGVKIKTPSRLHFSLIDLNGELGRIDGGIGITLTEPNWVIKIERSKNWSIPEICIPIIELIKPQIRPCNYYKIEFENSLPEHIGLGSQTQLSLALAHGISKLDGKQYTIKDLASIVHRGGTSGIGVAAYENGGFILDSGHAISDKPDFLPSHFSSAKPAVVLQRLKVPRDWYFVLVIPDVGPGKYGDEEVEIFKKHCPIPNEDVEKVSRIILMQLLPSIIEDDIEQFGDGLNKIQNIGFKRIENQLQDKFINKLQEFCIEAGATGTGLSSFGPTTYAVIRSKRSAKKLAYNINGFLTENGQKGTIITTTASNSGARVEFF